MSETPEPAPLPPAAEAQPLAEPISDPNNRRFYSEWDPRSAPGTYFLLAINIAVFVWMTLSGVPIGGGTPDQLMAFGAGNSVEVLRGEWWRLLTPIFVHIGIIHIGTNMWCLWNLGLLGEPLIGPFGLVAVYVLTGVAGNLLTLGWDVGYAFLQGVPLDHTVAGVGAGASGAVFGIAGILIVLLSNKRLPIPWAELKRLRRSVVQFSIINLVIGASTTLAVVGNLVHVRVDNTAHLGGFLSGLALGPGLTSSMTAGRVRYLNRQRTVFLIAAFILSLIGYGIANFNH